MADNRKNTVAGSARCDNVVQGSTGTTTVTRTVQSTHHEMFTKVLGQNRSKSPHSTVRGNVSSVEMARNTMSREKYIFKSYRPKMRKCYPKKVEGHFAEAPWKPNIEKTYLTDIWTVPLKLQKTAVFTYWGWEVENCEETANPFQFPSEISPMHSERTRIWKA